MRGCTFPLGLVRRGTCLFVAVGLVCSVQGAAAQGEAVQHPAGWRERGVARTAQASPSSALEVALRDTDQRLGPFRIGGQDFVVVLHQKQLLPAQPNGQGEAALSALEIQDASTATLYRETFTYTLEAGAFSDSCMASARLLQGGFTAGLLVAIGCLPSAPSSGDVWELFGLMNGELQRFGKPFTTDGDFLDVVPTPPTKLGTATLFQPDVLRFRVRTGGFEVTVPVLMDLLQGRVALGLRCFEQTGHGVRESGCEVPVAVDRVPSDQGLTFVRLFAEAHEGGVPRHVVVKPESDVKILAAKLKFGWDDSRDVIVFGVADRDPWLRVQIDGSEGWIHTPEDFNALGIPEPW